MPRSPYSADGLACARAALTDLRIIGAASREERLNIVGMALDILRKDRAIRLGPKAALAPVTGRVIRIPRAVFEAGRPKPPRRPRLIVLPAGPTPGDAA